MNRPPVEISHDAFARWCLMRESVAAVDVIRQSLSCSWCGCHRPAGGLFRYGTAPDDNPGRISWDRHTFCCVGCRRSFYEE